MEELSKIYDPKEVEDRIYKLWEKGGFFTPEKTKKGFFQKKFVTTIAPPNVTGELHMGHALEYILQDIIIRMRRMQGYETLWIPGFDHAGIATQNVVERELRKEGLSRYDLGREKFLERVWQWKERSQVAIIKQFEKMGLSVDWSRTRFTMDENYQKAVAEAFNHYKQKGWIYQGWRVINWCPRCQSAISDLEVEYKETKGKLYFIKYPLVDENGFITVATTRPETMLGDAAIAVNLNDERYKNLIGKKLVLPIQNREIPIIADEAVDINFGTGTVKVTPAHSIEDFEISQRHGLQVFEVIDKNAKMTKEAGPLCEGLKTSDCRIKVIEKIKELGLLEKEEELIHNVGYCARCGTVIEPLYSKQWFLTMKELAELAKKAVEDKKVSIHPDKWVGPYINWLANVRDWNISRQLWWGHKVPIDGEEDVLDTWFSSALWPFAVLGWPDKFNPDYKNFSPTNFITSGRDILHLWITRMIFSGIELTGKVPFKDVYVHATVLTKEGQRMSKSKGIGIDPLIAIQNYGADALRFGLAYQTTGIQDMKFSEDVILTGKKFANKLWNIARFVLQNTDNKEWFIKTYDEFSPESYSILDQFGITKKESDIFKPLPILVSKDIDHYLFGAATHTLYNFIWHDFADKYLEYSKKVLNSPDSIDKQKEEVKKVMFISLIYILKLLHPFMPFITEEIWSKLPITDRKMIIMEDWPNLKK